MCTVETSELLVLLEYLSSLTVPLFRNKLHKSRCLIASHLIGISGTTPKTVGKIGDLYHSCDFSLLSKLQDRFIVYVNLEKCDLQSC